MQGVSETQLQLGSGKGSGLNTDKQAGVEESRQSGETIILVVQYNPAGIYIHSFTTIHKKAAIASLL